MSLTKELIAEFHSTTRHVFGAVAREFNLEPVQTDDSSIRLLGQVVDVYVSIYPSHTPTVSVTLMPKGPQWARWRRDSPWGASGIMLAHLLAFREADATCPDTRFRTGQELRDRIDGLARDLASAGRDLLHGDREVLSALAAYADNAAQRAHSEGRLVGLLSSVAQQKKRCGP